MKLSSCCRPLCVEPSSLKANVLKLQRVSCNGSNGQEVLQQKVSRKIIRGTMGHTTKVAFFKESMAKIFPIQNSQVNHWKKNPWSHKDAEGNAMLCWYLPCCHCLHHIKMKWSPVDPTSAGVKRSPRTSCKVSSRFTGCHSYPVALLAEKTPHQYIYIHIIYTLYIYVYKFNTTLPAQIIKFLLRNTMSAQWVSSPGHWIPRRRSLEQTANCQTCWQSVDAKRVDFSPAFGEGHQAILRGLKKKHIKIRKKHDSVLHQKAKWTNYTHQI